MSPVPTSAIFTGPPRTGPRVNAAPPSATSAGTPATALRKFRRPVVFCSSVKFMVTPQATSSPSSPFQQQIQTCYSSSIKYKQDDDCDCFDQSLVHYQIRAFSIWLRHAEYRHVKKVEQAQKEKRGRGAKPGEQSQQ